MVKNGFIGAVAVVLSVLLFAMVTVTVGTIVLTNELALTAAPQVQMEKWHIAPISGNSQAVANQLISATQSTMPVKIAQEFSQRMQFVEQGVTRYETFTIEPKHGNTEAQLETWVLAMSRIDRHTILVVPAWFIGKVSFRTPTTPVQRSEKRRRLWKGLVGRPVSSTSTWIEHVPRGLHPHEVIMVADALRNAISSHPSYAGTNLLTPNHIRDYKAQLNFA